MNFNDVIKLIDAGYTKAEIDALASHELSSAQTSAQPAAASEPAAAAAEAPASAPEAEAAPQQDLSKLISEAIAKELKAFGEQMKMPAMPSIGDIQPKSIDDIVKKFFTEED